MGILSGMEWNYSLPPVSYNTGTHLDLATGVARYGVDNKLYIDGGLNRGINGVIGRAQTWKSTTAGSWIAEMMCFYSDSEALIQDNEESAQRDPDRFFRYALDFDLKNTRDIVFISGIYRCGDLLNRVREICVKREKEKKHLIVPSPFRDPRDQTKNMMVWKPLVVVIDTLTNLKSKKSEKILEEGIDDSGSNTVSMIEGKDKTHLISELRMLCEKYGLIVVCTAHVDTRIDMDPYNPAKKQLQFMRQNESIKGCGSSFHKLAIPMIETSGVAKLLNSTKSENLYAYRHAAIGDITEVSMLVQRNKSKSSGTIFTFVESQDDGLCPILSDYHAIRKAKYYGLVGNDQRHHIAFYPDKTITRNSIYEECSKSYEMRRALQLVSQYWFIQNYWNTARLPFDFSRTPEALYEELSKSKYKMEDILNSRGYWTYDKCDREYLSIFDVLELVNKK